MWLYPHLINSRQKKKESFTNKHPLKGVLQVEAPKKINQEFFSGFFKVMIFKERSDTYQISENINYENISKHHMANHLLIFKIQ